MVREQETEESLILLNVQGRRKRKAQKGARPFSTKNIHFPFQPIRFWAKTKSSIIINIIYFRSLCSYTQRKY